MLRSVWCPPANHVAVPPENIAAPIPDAASASGFLGCKITVIMKLFLTSAGIVPEIRKNF